MKNLFLILAAAVVITFPAAAQFKSTNGTAFSYVTTLPATDVFVTGTPGVTNHNLAASNVISAALAAGGQRATNAVNKAVENSPLGRGGFFVDAAYGSDTNTGGLSAPWASVAFANSNAVAGSTVYVCPGTYQAEITNANVIWFLARGATITNTLAVVVPPDGYIVTIRGDGAITSYGYAVILTDGAGADIQARLIWGEQRALDISTGSGKATCKISNTHIRGNLYAETFDQDPECIFQNCTFTGSDAGMTAPFSVAGCTATANPANANRSGSWVVNANLTDINP